MSNNNFVYPDWVQKYRVRGTTIKRKGDNFYLYRRTSKRVPGKKYPQTVDTYIGVITQDGVIDAEKKVVPVNSGCEVYEYGFSNVLMRICPEEWKKANGNDWQKILLVLINKISDISYLKHEFEIPDENDYRVAWKAQYSSLIRKIKNAYDVERRDLECLKTIFIVYLGKAKFISHISEEQQRVLDQLGISELEVH